MLVQWNWKTFRSQRNSLFSDSLSVITVSFPACPHRDIQKNKSMPRNMGIDSLPPVTKFAAWLEFAVAVAMHLRGSLCSVRPLQSKGFSIKPAGIGFTVENLPCGIKPLSQECLSTRRAQANIFFRLNMFWLRQRQVSIGCGGDTGSVIVPNDII